MFLRIRGYMKTPEAVKVLQSSLYFQLAELLEVSEVMVAAELPYTHPVGKYISDRADAIRKQIKDYDENKFIKTVGEIRNG